MKRRKKGFTLAEILIALTVIGVIAAVTVPVLMQNTNKQEKIVKMKKAYSEMSQALKMAELEYGPMNTWDFDGNELDYETEFAENYLFKNMNLIKKCKYAAMGECITKSVCSLGAYGAIAANGYSFCTWVHGSKTGGWINVDVNGPDKGPNTNGKDIFSMRFTYSEDDPWNGRVGFYPRGLDEKTYYSREELLNKIKGGGTEFCAGLLALDSWELKEDNPCF